MNMSTQKFAVRNSADLGRTIAEARTLTNVSQTELSAQTGIDRSYLSRMEGGLSTVHIERLFVTLRALGVRLEARMEVDDE